MYGGQVGEELQQALVRETLPVAIRESGVEPVAEHQVDAPLPQPGEPYTYSVVLEVKPAITLPDLAGLPARRPPVEVTREDVERASKRSRKARRRGPAPS